MHFTDVVKFDNGYSWARSKKLHYWIELLERNEKVETEMVTGEVVNHEGEEEDEGDGDFVQASEG